MGTICLPVQGLLLDFEQAGFDVAAAVEIDPIHCAVRVQLPELHYRVRGCIQNRRQEDSGEKAIAQECAGVRRISNRFSWN
jgi:hypothetical protein